MKSLYWAWAAVAADLAIFAGTLPMSRSLAAFIEVCAMHASACAALATVCWLMLPRRYRGRPVLAWILMFDFSFIAPVIGALVLLVTLHLTLRRGEGAPDQAQPRSVDLPAYEIQFKSTNRSGQGAVRARLSSKVPDHIRLQSLISLQSVSRRVANPILEDLLGDAADDVRLVAFGMLDAEEKRISTHISRERQSLQRDLSFPQYYTTLRHLAELHWELIYASLAQGELRKHILGEARRYADAAFELDIEHDSGVLLLRGRILLEQGELEEAEQCFLESLARGQAESSALPYLAEVAYRRRDFAVVGEMMQRLSRQHLSANMKSIVELWTRQSKVDTFRDRRILPHI